jgi:hypothetical protein
MWHIYLFNMKRQYVFLAFALLLVGITLLFHASATQHKARTVTIGAVIPLTGANSYFGTVEKRGLEMAIDELNTSQKKYTFALKLENASAHPKTALQPQASCSPWNIQQRSLPR